MTVIPNGVDTEYFRRLDLTARKRLALLRRWLVDDPRGWDESSRPGTVRYSLADLSAFAGSTGVHPVLLYVGRFTAVKRLSLLLRAYARVSPARSGRTFAHLGRLPRRVGRRTSVFGGNQGAH